MIRVPNGFTRLEGGQESSLALVVKDPDAFHVGKVYEITSLEDGAAYVVMPDGGERLLFEDDYVFVKRAQDGDFAPPKQKPPGVPEWLAQVGEVLEKPVPDEEPVTVAATAATEEVQETKAADAAGEDSEDDEDDVKLVGPGGKLVFDD